MHCVVPFAFLTVLSLATAARAQTDESPSMVDHPGDQRVYVGGQMNFIFQRHGAFPALYTGPQSFKPTPEQSLSRLLTLQTGLRLGRGWDVVFDLESAGGRGLSDALGLAGFTDLDVVRNPSLGSKPYVARILFHAILNLDGEPVHADRNFLSLAAQKFDKRLEIYAGKLSLADLF